MKKTLKKLTSLTLVLMLVFSVFSVQASAGLFDKIESVKPVYEIVTAREIEEYINLLNEYKDKYDIEIEESDYYLGIDVCYEVTLTTGEVIEVTDYGYGENASGKRTILAYTEIDIRDYQKAVKKGEATIPYTYEMYLYSSIGVEMDHAEGQGEVEIIDCHVKDLIPVSGLPTQYREYSTIEYLLDLDESFDMEGAVFDIIYNDGTKKRSTVEMAYDEEYEYSYYVLDGEEIYSYFNYDEENVSINYMDFELIYDVEFIPFPISEIIIDNVELSADFEPLSVTYTVIKPDKSKENFTFEFTGEPDTELLGINGYLAGSVEDYPIFIGTYKGYTDDYPSKELLEVVIMADVDIMDVEEIEGAQQEDNIINRIIYKVRMFLLRVFDFLYYFY